MSGPEEMSRDELIVVVTRQATKHGLNQLGVLRDALTGRPWIPELPAPT